MDPKGFITAASDQDWMCCWSYLCTLVKTWAGPWWEEALVDFSCGAWNARTWWTAQSPSGCPEPLGLPVSLGAEGSSCPRSVSVVCAAIAMATGAGSTQAAHGCRHSIPKTNASWFVILCSEPEWCSQLGCRGSCEPTNQHLLLGEMLQTPHHLPGLLGPHQ